MLSFEWDPAKNELNIRNHGIDFEDAIAVFEGSMVISRSDRDGEVRWKGIGMLEGREVAAVYTIRGESYRIISVRRARINEREAYRKAHPGG